MTEAALLVLDEILQCNMSEVRKDFTDPIQKQDLKAILSYESATTVGPLFDKVPSEILHGTRCA